ncbi:MAG: hypothetical protein Q7S02_04225, partial [bacterium]|nr:hypothetical protein [bacterium]
QIAFVDANCFGGGEEGDGRDLHGRTIRRRSARDAETTDPWGRVVPTAEDILVAQAEGRGLDPWSLSEDEGAAEIDGHPPVTVNGVPLEDALADGQFDTLSPEDAEIELAHLSHEWYVHEYDAWNDDLASQVRIETRPANGATTALEWIKREALASSALNRFERDGITKIGSRLAAELEFGSMAFARGSRSGCQSWKRSRPRQQRPCDYSRFLETIAGITI